MTFSQSTPQYITWDDYWQMRLIVFLLVVAVGVVWVLASHPKSGGDF